MKNNKKVIEILFTLVGTAMVTITFFVHEVKRETVKELRELIVQQRNTTLIREDIRKLANDVVGLQSRVASLRESPSAYASSGSIWMAFDGNMGARANLRASVLQYLDNTRLLAQRVDNSDSYLQRIDRLL